MSDCRDPRTFRPGRTCVYRRCPWGARRRRGVRHRLPRGTYPRWAYLPLPCQPRSCHRGAPNRQRRRPCRWQSGPSPSGQRPRARRNHAHAERRNRPYRSHLRHRSRGQPSWCRWPRPRGWRACLLQACHCAAARRRCPGLLRRTGPLGKWWVRRGCRLHLVLPGRVSAWPVVESARETPCVSPVEMPICTVRTHGLDPQKLFYRPDIGGIIREMSTPASLSWRRYGSNDVRNGVSAGPASALR